MVFQKKGASTVKNTQANKKKGKKSFEADDLDMFDDMDDSDDFEEDSDEDMPVQKTPQNKTPKGRQSMSEKKVSFEIPDKTPAKTPQKNSSFIVKKTPTPAAKGKTSLQEFKGMKGKAQQEKAGEDDSDEDDDEDDDEEENLDLEIDEDMDEEDDSDEEEEDSDDNEDGEDEGQKKQTNNAVQLKQKTPVKATSNLIGNQTPKGQTPKSEIKKEKNNPKKEIKEEERTLKDSAQVADEVQRRRERDAKSLYIANLPKGVKPEELKELSKDIQEVIIPRSTRNFKSKKVFAFLTFISEAKAEANYKILQNKKFRDQPLCLDYVGVKSTKRSAPIEEKTFNMKKLYVTGVPIDATLAQVAEYFPTAFQITFNKSPLFRSATINFWTEEETNKAFQANKEIELMGHKLVVIHSTASGMSRNSKRKKVNKNNQNKQENPPKKMKVVKQEEKDEESSDEE